MPLNYKKWDALEVSDDSDIEGHPNVDHKSLVRWKQRDIHERREQQKMKIANLEAQIDCNKVLKARLIDIVPEIQAKGPPYYSQLVERLKTKPSREGPPSNANGGPSYDDMICNALQKVWGDCKDAGVKTDDPELGEKLATGVQKEVTALQQDIEEKATELEAEKRERDKKITSENIKDAWDSKYVPAKPEPAPLVKPKPAKTKKTTTTEFETLNSKPVQKPAIPSGVTAPTAADSEEEDDAEDESDTETPSLTPALRQFSQIKLTPSHPATTFQTSFDFIQAHPEVIVEGAVDALLLEAFSSQLKAAKGDRASGRYAHQCVHQGLLLQYCEKLGRDGVRMFFRKMISGDNTAIAVFEEDVKKTYQHVMERAKYHAENTLKESQKEAIQLVAENNGGSSAISFNVPDGPPPENLRLEGPGTEDLDVEEVRKALQLRWEIFQMFKPDMQSALYSQELDEVNKVLAKMEVEEAESVVERLQISGILNFSEPGVRDITGEDSQAS